MSYDPVRDLPPTCTCTWVCKEKMEGTFGTPRGGGNQRPGTGQPRGAGTGGCLLLIALLVMAVVVVLGIIGSQYHRSPGVTVPCWRGRAGRASTSVNQAGGLGDGQRDHAQVKVPMAAALLKILNGGGYRRV